MIRHSVVWARALVMVVLGLAASRAVAGETPRAVVTPVSELQWTEAGIPGVQIAAVRGDRAKGPSHFYLKYAAGLATPLHHHSANHYVTTLTGNLVLVADKKEHRLPPGSYFAFLGKAPHMARCEGDQDCVMFVDARAPWDVVAAARAEAGSR